MSNAGCRRCRGTGWIKQGGKKIRCPGDGNLSASIPTASTRLSPETPVSPRQISAQREYDAFQTLLKEQPIENPSLPSSGPVSSLDDISEDAIAIAGLISSSLGESEETGQALLRAHQATGNPYSIADRSEAVRRLSTNVPSSAHQETFDALIRKIDSGEIVLTQRELDGLVSIRDSILASQVESSLSLRTGEWVHSRPARNCTLCGQFISERIAHTTCNRKTLDEEKISGLTQRILKAKSKQGYRYHKEGRGDFRLEDVRDDESIKRIALPGKFFADGKDRKFFLGDTEGIHEQEIEDVFSNAGAVLQIEPDLMDSAGPSMLGDPVLREAILMSYMEKSLFGKTYTLNLPEGVRDSLLDSPTALTIDTFAAVASTIEPPFSSREIEHLIDVGGPNAAWALLNTERTRATALNIMETSPSDAAAFLSEMGLLPDETVRRMTLSPDPLIRRTAAIAPNLASSDQDFLICDPDEDVRLACIDTRYGYQEAPRTAASYDRHLSREALSKAWREVNYSPQRVNEWERLREIMNTLEHKDTSTVSPAVKGHQSSGGMPSLLDREPRYLETFLTDPQSTPRVISAAIASRPYSRQAYAAIAAVTDPARIAAIQGEYDERRTEYLRQAQANVGQTEKVIRGENRTTVVYGEDSEAKKTEQKSILMEMTISNMLEERNPSPPGTQFRRMRERISVLRGTSQLAMMQETRKLLAEGTLVPTGTDDIVYCLSSRLVNNPEIFRGRVPDDVLDAAVEERDRTYQQEAEETETEQYRKEKLLAQIRYKQRYS